MSVNAHSSKPAACLLNTVRSWGESRDWAGWDPYDGLNSPFAPILSLGSSRGRRLVIQAVKRSPVNLRRVLRVAPSKNSMSIALVASAYARLGTGRPGNSVEEVLARRHGDWLLDHASVSDNGKLAWGYNFDVETRFFHYSRFAPNMIATTFGAHTLLDLYDAFGDAAHLDAAGRTVKYVLSDAIIDTGEATYFRYIDQSSDLIHNANVLAASLVARYCRVMGESIPGAVERAIFTSLGDQQADGSWPYSTVGTHRWVDNFHTGYILEALAWCRRVKGVEPALARGLAFWRSACFAVDGTPKYYPTRLYPLDAQCYAQAIETSLACWGATDETVAWCESIASLLQRDLVSPTGFVYAQRGRLFLVRAPVVRWSNAAVFRALAKLAAWEHCG